MSGSCSESSCGCEEKASSCGSGGCETSSGCPACGTACGGQPVACAAGMWKQAYFTALKAVQTDIMKAKIQKAWGARMEKSADAVFESMGGIWQSMLAQSKAKSELYEGLARAMQESGK